MTTYETKHSGEKAEFDSGMVRDVSVDKPRFDLVVPEGIPFEDQLLTRMAWLMARGAKHYGDRNWEKATGNAERARFKESAFRHFMQWYFEESDEDHAVATIFNMQGRELIDWKRRQVDEVELEQALAAIRFTGSNALEPGLEDEIDQETRATMLAAGLIHDGFVAEEFDDADFDGCCGGVCKSEPQDPPRMLPYPDPVLEPVAWADRHSGIAGDFTPYVEAPHHSAARGQTDDEKRAIQESIDRD